ncbi:MAG: hypothetical protein ACLT4Y_07865 [Bifidobacterium breve]
MEHAAQADAQEHDGGAEQQRVVRTPIFLMMIGTTPIIADSRKTWKPLSVP